MKNVFFTILIILILYADLSIVSACTIFSVTEDGTTMVGNNEDRTDKGLFKKAKVWFLPQEYGKYGRMFFGLSDAYPMGGMNDQGLFFDFFANEELNITPGSPEKLNYAGSLSEKILEECSTVNQVLDMYKKYNENIFRYSDAQIMYVDKEGASAVVSWDWDKNELRVIEKSGSFQTVGYGCPIINPELSYDNSDISIQRFSKLLDNAHQGDFTIYSNIYDLNKKEVYVYCCQNYGNSIKLNLEDELRKGEHLYNLYDLFPEQKLKMSVNDYFFKELSIQEILMPLIFLVPLIAWPAYYLIRRHSKKKQTMNMSGKALHITWIVTVLNSILGLLLLYFIFRYAPFLVKYGYNIMGRAYTHLPFYMILFTAGQILVLVYAWKHKRWNKAWRVFFSLTAIYAVYFIILINKWSLLFV